MTRKFYHILFLILIALAANVVSAQKTMNPKFEKKIDRLISYKVPVIYPEEAYNHFSDYLFLDARESEEYTVSHIQNSINVGYDDFNISAVEHISKDKKIIIYCSIGYRSDKIGGKLKKAGFINVYNLFGSIFEWVNQEYPIVDNQNQPTLQLHTYNKSWSKWVENSKIEKVW